MVSTGNINGGSKTTENNLIVSIASSKIVGIVHDKRNLVVLTEDIHIGVTVHGWF